ncbi:MULTISPECIES: GyrI-like domain-containing protein [unclassified Beijerinckia]|uniref:GyrI-like domain-containing protein n=1 Tax=unclassified Beijerinckia TaxID=2638183 RepID=UPI00089A44D1|nr:MULTISPECIES: GyrI-like domain-containing protein [unclassified Beijerinckia]MDH7793987.1 hypothetical protein [Beijerinckia sp. GAS462]SEB50841.1 hypothetical protein SAMN05443249_0252 [Beijerinckia sp. 28-YEA-48]
MKGDIKIERKDLYAPAKGTFSLVDVPALRFLMIDGQGDPNTAQSYKEALEALYSVSYTLKFASKKTLDKDYVVRPLEGLWWADDMRVFRARAKDVWRWTMMIGQPDWIDPAMVAQAIETQRKKGASAAIDLLRLETFEEGRCVQILHIGSYDDEGPVLQRLHDEFLPANGFAMSGKHHEIYLSDARKTAPEKLKTILRQPVRAAG